MVLFATLPINQTIPKISFWCLRSIVFLILKVVKFLISVKVIVDWELLVEMFIVVLKIWVIVTITPGKTLTQQL
jgi:hypothetical protein